MYGAASESDSSAAPHRLWLNEAEYGTQAFDERAQCAVHEVLT